MWGWLGVVGSLMMMLALLLLGAGQAAATDRRCGADPDQHVRHCLNETHTSLRGCTSGELLAGSARRCDAGFGCSASTGACEAADIGTHLLRSVDYQIVETVIASEAQTCSEQDPLADAIAGKMLCEVLHATTVVQPTFGHSLGNTWETAPPSQAGTIDGCNFTTAAGWRACIGRNVGRQAALLTARAPHLLISAGLMEFLSQRNLDDPEAFESCCRPGTVGNWGGNDTCVPDVATTCIQEYLRPSLDSFLWRLPLVPRD